jgi:hypothetical protein
MGYALAGGGEGGVEVETDVVRIGAGGSGGGREDDGG